MNVVDDPVFYEEDGYVILDTVIFMMNHKSMQSFELDLENSKKVKVYWVGTTLHINIEGLK